MPGSREHIPSPGSLVITPSTRQGGGEGGEGGGEGGGGGDGEGGASGQACCVRRSKDERSSESGIVLITPSLEG